MSFGLPEGKLVEQDGSANTSFKQWLSNVHRVIVSLQQSGTTANRPASILWIGRRYFDTTLGLPVWWNGSAWVNSGATMYHGTATLDFPSIGINGVEELTITVTGASVGDRVAIAAPSTLEPSLTFSGFVSATNTVTIRVHNNKGVAHDPPAEVWGATVFSAT